LGGGVLALSYARFILHRIISDQSMKVSDIKKALRESEAELKKEISDTNDTLAKMGKQLGERKKGV